MDQVITTFSNKFIFDANALDVGSKNANPTVPGFSGKAGQIPCFHNGKLATPQSLIPRKTVDYAPKKKEKAEGVAIPKPIEENVSDQPSKLSR